MKKRSAPQAGGLKFHLLFAPIEGLSGPDFVPETIWRIFIVRFETRGPVHALRPFTPEELDSNAAIHQRFGGGTYELIARRENGTIYAKRTITLEGDAKSMNGEPAPSANGASAAPAANGPPPLPPPANASETMLHYMMQMNMQQMTMLGNVMVAMVGGSKQDAAEQARAMGETMKATIEAMKSAMPAPSPQQSTMQAVKEAIEVAKSLQPPPPAPVPVKEESTADIVGALGGALGNFMQLAAAAAQNPAILPGAAAPVVGPMG